MTEITHSDQQRNITTQRQLVVVKPPYGNACEVLNESDQICPGHPEKSPKQTSDPAYIHTISMTELLDTPYPPQTAVIENLLYTGTYILAGAPKIGKSFLVAQLAYHISAGIPLWDNPVHQGTVLYLALEDDYPRLQRRMSQMFGVESVDNLHFTTEAKQIGAGLDEQIEYFLDEHPDTRLIIIDTLQKVRGFTSETYSYAGDYFAIGKLKQLADTHGICLLIVHHTRKQGAQDKFEQISGTTGILGCADGAFMLYKDVRTDLTAFLEVVGRDQPDQKINLKRDTEHLYWLLEKRETAVWTKPIDPLVDKIADILTTDNPKWEGSAAELALWLGGDIQPNILTRKLNVLVSDLLEHNIIYENKRTRTGSRISLKKIGDECDDCDDKFEMGDRS